MLLQPLESVSAGTKSAAAKKRLAGLERLGIEDRLDLLLHLPRRYEDRRIVTPIGKLRTGQTTLIEGSVVELSTKRLRSHLSVNKARVRDATGEVTVTFFNQDYVLERSRPGARWVIFGVLERFRGETVFQMREVDISGSGKSLGKGTILAVYPATASTPQSFLRKQIFENFYRLERSAPWIAPQDGMPGFVEALRMVHFPRAFEEIEAGRRRLAFDELLTVRLCVERALRRRKPIERIPSSRSVRLELPYRLTSEQEEILAAIRQDLTRDRAMRRLVEGDVGSGKTVLAVLAGCRVAERGQKTVFMSPTEILAEQHFGAWREALEKAGVAAFLLTGATSAADRKRIHAAAESDEAAFFFGTHALIFARADYRDLGLVVIDEQQRFGVAQREEILRRGGDLSRTPDLLILSATPIPRTLAMTLYGDLEISALRTRLPGRREVRTVHLRDSERGRMMPFLRGALERNERIYIVYPLIEEEEGLELRDAKGQHAKIAAGFPDVGTGLLTGNTKPKEKEKIMRAFRDGGISILVATSVVEVGIDVPEATVMVIEHAEHFGLAQLHQLRGRVGRSERESVCVLTTADELNDYAARRIRVLVECQDGFRIAEEDLDLRGPGEILGERQSGGSELRVARLGTDFDLVPRAAEGARRMLDEDPKLEKNELYRDMYRKLIGRGAGKM